MLIKKLALLRDYNKSNLIIFKLENTILGGKYKNKYLLPNEIEKLNIEELIIIKKLIKLLKNVNIKSINKN